MPEVVNSGPGLFAAGLLALLLAACAGSEPVEQEAMELPLLAGSLLPGFGGERPVEVYLPPDFQQGQASGLLVLLHGYAVDGLVQEAYLRLAPEAARRQMVYLAPDGRMNGTGQRFWNASPACCDFEGQGVDDVAYLLALIEEVQARLDLAAVPVFLVGYSNGGFMAQRLACEAAGRFKGVASIAGAIDLESCRPNGPVRFLQVHGELDLTILYGGGTWFGDAYPGAVATAQAWAGNNDCREASAMAPDRDLELLLPGAETRVRRWSECSPGSPVELWTIRGAGHAPVFSPDFSNKVLEYLLGEKDVDG